MPEIIIYTAPRCPYCTMAKKLLERKGAVYTEI
ncbi:MAG: glutaredoxin domain-containing protein, partial [Methylomonas sp.]